MFLGCVWCVLLGIRLRGYGVVHDLLGSFYGCCQVHWAFRIMGHCRESCLLESFLPKSERGLRDPL